MGGHLCTPASGASRWHCTAVCGTRLWAVDPVSVCLACDVGPLDASFPSYAIPFLLLLFSSAIFTYGQMALASISTSVIDNTLFYGNFQADQQWVSAFFCLFVIMLDLMLNSATFSFMKTDRHTKKLKPNNLGTTSGKNTPQPKLCVWSRSLHYLHSGWNAFADPLLLESFILLCLLSCQLGVTHLDTLVTSVQPLCCFL